MEDSLVEDSLMRGNQTAQSASAKLLSRAIVTEYLQDQTARVAEAEQIVSTDLCSTLVFRLGAEWLALPAGICQQILPPQTECRVPYRSNATLLGMVNVRGQLLLKVSLLPALRLTGQANKQMTQKAYRRMVVVAAVLESGDAETWAFDVDEMYGVYAVSLGDLQPVAAGSAAATETCTRYLFDWEGQQVSFLDDIKLFDSVRRRAL